VELEQLGRCLHLNHHRRTALIRPAGKACAAQIRGARPGADHRRGVAAPRALLAQCLGDLGDLGLEVTVAKLLADAVDEQNSDALFLHRRVDPRGRDAAAA
jgi:hypothetical protein